MCRHNEVELRYREFGNGRSYCRQCIECGEMVMQGNGGYFISVGMLTVDEREAAKEFINYRDCNPGRMELF